MISITAPARLHLGFLDLHGGLGRRFGSLGLTLEAPVTVVRARRASAAEVDGPVEAERSRAILERLTAAWALPPLAATIESAIPAHAGLGSGTQLALALGTAAARLVGRAATPLEIAAVAQRGVRSGIGIGAFAQGGFLIDGGRGAGDEAPPLIARATFPEDWPVLLILDPAREGLHGAREERAFRELAPCPAELAGHLCRVAMMQLLPSLAVADHAGFAAAIGEIQRRVGDYFAPAQGARFASAEVSAALDWLQAEGVAGHGQSSWGPTGFAILPSAREAGTLRAKLARRFAGSGLRFELTRASNRGAEITPKA